MQAQGSEPPTPSKNTTARDSGAAADTPYQRQSEQADKIQAAVDEPRGAPLQSNPLASEDARAAVRPSSLSPTEQMTDGPASKDEGSLPSSLLPGPGSRAPGKKSISFRDDPEPRSTAPERPSSADAPRLRDDDETPRRETGPASPPRRDGQEQTTRPGGLEPRDSQRQLNEYRENLARQMERRELQPREGQPAAPGLPRRISPIQEENSPSSLPRSTESEPTTTSTESGHTVRGWSTPGLVAATPSYPFPRMASYGFLPSAVHRPFTTLSPTVLPEGARQAGEAFKGHDVLASYPSTPASNVTFMPAGLMASIPDHPDFPTPNLYELALMLSAEPGLDAWWQTVVQIMVDVYKAERVNLAIPADSTDIENVPWGQKATYNAHREDDLSLGYLAKGSSLVPSSTDETSENLLQQVGEPFGRQEAPVRPGLTSRHSFTSYEQNRQTTAGSGERVQPAAPQRPRLAARSKSHHPSTSTPFEHDDDPHLPSLNQRALEEHDALEEQQQEIPSWEAPFTAPREGHGKVLDVLQALDYEADPLIDHNGVLRILERGRVVALTRTYPYLKQDSLKNKASDARAAAGAGGSKSPERLRKKVRKPRSDSLSKLSTILGGATSSTGTGRTSKTSPSDRKPTSSSRLEVDAPKPAAPRYEEYEQAPPSPWSQSPAPSPAVRADPSENPFFTDAMVDEDTFNPSPATADYMGMMPPEAIGVDNSWTVLHIPLTHVLLSKPNPVFKLDPSLMEQKITARKHGDPTPVSNPSPERPPKEKHAPIAILSILSPIIPYPSNLRQSLENLAPHLATSFSLCRHYTNLETELSGLQKRRPQTAGFGALGPDGRPLADPTALASLAYLPAEDNASRASLAGSMTSPSDYSGPSRSATGSAGGTPGWDPSSLGFIMDNKRAITPSPAPVNMDSYFSPVPKAPATAQRARRDSRDEKRSSLRLSGGKVQLQDPTSASPVAIESRRSIESARQDSDETSPPGAQQRRPTSREKQEQASGGEKPGTAATHAENQKKALGTPGPAPHRHTQLHSYGADFASTFQSLPPSSTIARGVPPVAAPSRSGSIAQTDMTPPSDRLKGLILDSLPAHVFVALPQTGEIVWVNSRFLTYRGQTSGDLAADPWGSLHPDDREEYLRAWSLSVRTGEQFSRTVRIRRFDGAYRWFYARAVASKDKRGVILQFLGSYMDIHDQHIAELRAARQEEIEASEAKHRLLANLIPQIIFTATEDEGITFANEQWLSYTGQDFNGVLGLGFMDYVHPDDLAKCRIPPSGQTAASPPKGDLKKHGRSFSADLTAMRQTAQAPGVSGGSTRGRGQTLSRNDSSSSSGSNGGSTYDLPTANLTELARKGVIKVSTDSSGRLSYTTEIRLRSKSGEYRWHLIRCVEIDNVDFGNGASSYFGSATDINDLKLLETKLKEAMDSKGRFLSNMSHEIRTPLIGISGMVSFLQDTTLNEEQRDYTNTIQTSANSLLMIINDILDLSKVDAGMMKLSYEWFHTRSLIEDVNELVSTMAIAKRLELNYVVEEDVPAWVKGDRVRIRQVLLNVIGNAIKFTNEGEVFSRCKVVRPEGVEVGSDEIMLEFSIIDTGRGFTKAEAELIFKPFSQIDGSSTRQHGGSGLGLVISRQLVELHGGKMEGTAVPGKGSTFTFSAKFGLPTEDDHPDASTVPQPTPGLIRDTPLPTQQQLSFAGPLTNTAVVDSPSSATTNVGSPAAASSGSSQMSASSGRSRLTDRSSMTSMNSGLARFSQAARASGQDLSQMKLEMPSHKGGSTPPPTSAPGSGKKVAPARPAVPRPPMYSILIICTQTHSREATTKHIEMTLPKDIPHQITAVASVEEAHSYIRGADAIRFTHIVVNLPSPEEIVALMGKLMHSESSTALGDATVLILSDSVQRQAVSKLVAGTKYEDSLSEGKVTYIYKPVKPSRFAVIFDPAKERDLSIDHNRSTAQRLVEDQRQSYMDMERRMGGKGYKVLLVEDNPVNQKVLQKYLKRVGVAVELAADGVECIDMVFARGWGYYALILCDLHMPRMDGYQACREVRAWEKTQLQLQAAQAQAQAQTQDHPGDSQAPPPPTSTLPIIALSANVMSDVHDKCVEAGFNDYVTKPVDFIDLSRVLAKFF